MKKVLLKLIEDSQKRIVIRLGIWAFLTVGIAMSIYLHADLKKIQTQIGTVAQYYSLTNDIAILTPQLTDSIVTESGSGIYKKILPGWDGVALWLAHLESNAMTSGITVSYTMDSLTQPIPQATNLALLYVNMTLHSRDSSLFTIINYIHNIATDTTVETRLESIDCAAESNGLSKTFLRLGCWMRL